MALKQFVIDCSKLSNDKHLRNDAKFHSFLHFSNWNLFDTRNNNLIALKDVLEDDYNLFKYEDDKDYKGIPTGQQYLDEDGEIINYQVVSKDEHPNRIKYRVSSKNILLSSLRLAKSPALYFENKDLSEYVFSNGFYIFQVNKNWNIKFVLYILRTKRLKSVLDNHIYRGIGISAYKADDLLKIKIPLIPKQKQDETVLKIKPIENKIKNLKSQIKQPQEIINEVFAREFNFDLEKFTKSKNKKFFDVEIADINTSLIRSTVIQNKTSSNYLKLVLSNKNFTFLKNLLVKPISRGKQPIYTDYGSKVIKTLNIQNGNIEFDNTQFVSNEFLEENKEKAGIYKNDLLLTSTGMGRGKFALYQGNEICLADSHISVIRIDQLKTSPLFLNYYCQSLFGCEQLKYIEIHIKGTPEIYAEQLNYFRVPVISLSEQQRIVDEIKTELDKQETIKKQIEEERNKIDKIIEKVIRDA